VVTADAGLGKSTLLDDLVARADVVHVARADADELEQGRPFGVVLRALGCTPGSPDDRRRHVASLLHALPRSEADELLGTLAGDRFVIQDAIVELVEALAAERALLLVVDDAQWADAASLATLAVLVRQTRSLPVGLVVATRPWAQRAELALLVERIERAGGTHLRLDGLHPDAVEQLAGRELDAPPGPQLRRSLAAAAGNPFYVCELLRHARADGRTPRGGRRDRARWRPHDRELPRRARPPPRCDGCRGSQRAARRCPVRPDVRRPRPRRADRRVDHGACRTCSTTRVGRGSCSPRPTDISPSPTTCSARPSPRDFPRRSETRCTATSPSR
jgi:hypothetical protein